MAVNKEFLIAEKDLVHSRLEFAIQSFYDNPSKDSLTKIFNELVYSVIYNLAFHVPVDSSNGKPSYALMSLPNMGYAYKACTNSEELAKCSETSSVIISIRKLFERVANDSLVGLALNPSSGNKAIVFLNKENVQNILRIASESIDAQPDDVKKFLLKEI